MTSQISACRNALLTDAVRDGSETLTVLYDGLGLSIGTDNLIGGSPPSGSGPDFGRGRLRAQRDVRAGRCVTEWSVIYRKGGYEPRNTARLMPCLLFRSSLFGISGR